MGFFVSLGAAVFLTACVLAALLILERWKRRLAAHVEARNVGSQSPTTFTRKASQSRFELLPEYAHG